MVRVLHNEPGGKVWRQRTLETLTQSNIATHRNQLRLNV
jgi:hypothetical protein